MLHQERALTMNGACRTGVALGEPGSEWGVTGKAQDMTVHYRRLYRHCALGLHYMYLIFFFLQYELNLAYCDIFLLHTLSNFKKF